MTLNHILTKILYCIYPIFVYEVIQSGFLIFLGNTPVFSAMVSAIISMILIAMLKRKSLLNLKEIVVFPNKNMYVPALVMGITTNLSLSGLVTLFLLKVHIGSFKQVSEVLFSENILIQIFGIGLLIPVVEEFLFRNIVYNRLKNAFLNTSISILFCSILFGLFHQNIVQMITGVIAGLLLCYLYEKAETILAPILFHIGFNMSSVFLTKINIHIDSIKIFSLIIVISFFITIMCLFFCRMMSKKRTI